MITKFQFTSLCFVLAGALSAGCASNGEEAAPGALTLEWAAGPNSNCAAAGINTVELELTQGQKLIDVRRFPCSDQAAYVDAVSPGRYDLTVRGIDASGIHTFDATVPGVEVVEATRIDLGTVRLAARPATVALQWYFGNGRLCSQNRVDRIGVTVYDSELYYVGDAVFDCEAGIGELDPVPAGSYQLEVSGLGVGSDQALARALYEVEVTRGAAVMVEVALDEL